MGHHRRGPGWHDECNGASWEYVTNEHHRSTGGVVIISIIGEAYVAIRPETGGFFTELESHMGLGLGVAVAVVAGATAKMASDFQASMMLISTQAGLPKEKIKGLSDAVLELAGKVGIGPDSLAESLYYVESSFAKVGLTATQAMNLVKIAAEGARIGNANLKDVTTALDAAVTSGIPGVENYDQAMGALNATVGAGEMTMQDLVSAFGSGAIITAKNFGLSIRDVGAALAVFGDNNIRGAQAGTQLKMMLQSMVKPTKDGEGMLRQLGITTGKLALDMQQGGLNKALQDLRTHMEAAGITGLKTGDWITNAFGKRAGVGMTTLLTLNDKLQASYLEIDKGVNSFAKSWESTQSTTKQKMAEAEAALQALGIKIGMYVLPLVNDLAQAFTVLAPILGTLIVGALHDVGQAIKFISEHQTVFEVIAAAIAGVFTPALVAMGAAALVSAAETAYLAASLAADWIVALGPIAWIVAAVVALAVVIYKNWDTIKKYTVEAWQAVSGFVKRLWSDVEGFTKDAWNRISGAVWGAIQATGRFFERLPGYAWDAVKAVGKFLLNLPETIAYAAGFALASMINMGVSMMRGWWDILGSAWNAGVHFFLDLPKNIWNLVVGADKWLLKTGEDLIKGFWDAVVHNAETFWNWLKSLPGTIGGFVKDAYNWLGTSGHQMFMGFLDKLLAKAEDLWKWLKDLPGNVINGIIGIDKWLWDSGKNLIQGLINGIGDMQHVVIDKVKDVAKSAVKGFTDAIKIGSPSRVFTELARSIPQGIAAGIMKDGHLPSMALAGIVGNMTGGFGGPKMSMSGANINLNVNAPGATQDTVSALRSVANDSVATALRGVIKGVTVGAGTNR